MKNNQPPEPDHLAMAMYQRFCSHAARLETEMLNEDELPSVFFSQLRISKLMSFLADHPKINPLDIYDARAHKYLTEMDSQTLWCAGVLWEVAHNDDLRD